MQGLFEAVIRHAAAVDIRINASKTKVISALIPGEQRQAVRLDGEPLEDVDKFKYLGHMCSANDQGTEGHKKQNYSGSFRILSPENTCLWQRRAIWLRTKGRVYQAVVRYTVPRHGLYE